MALRWFQALFSLAALAMLAPAMASSITHKYKLKFEGEQRAYMVVTPDTCVSDCPVILDLHGFLGSGRSQKRDSGLLENGAVNGYIVVYADGVQRSWNGGKDYGSCCGYAVENDINDVGFLREVIARVAAEYPVDSRRVYASGWSNGCAMAQRLAVEASDVFAAVSCTGEYLLKATKKLDRPIAVSEIHAFNDLTIRYDRTDEWPGAVNNGRRWAKLNGCRDVPTRTYLTKKSYVDVHDDCDGGVSVKLYSLAHSEHDTYHHSDGLDLAQIIWDDVKGYRLP